MQLVYLTDKKQLNDFVSSQPMSQFLQSYDWGKFQEKVSGKVRWIGVKLGGELVASAQVVSKDLPIGQKYLYCARGPIIAKNAKKKAVTRLIFEGMKKLAERNGMMFLRFEPSDKSQILNLPHGPHHHYFGKASQRGIKYKIIKTIDVQPPQTLVLDLSQSESELLGAMHQKTRYNINLAKKKGVKIVEGGKARFEDFWRLLDQTTGRDKFRSHGRDYYQAMLDLPDRLIKLFFAEDRGQPIATAMVSFFGDTASYLHGGSANKERNIMAPYLLQWQAIKTAKDQGLKYYDFYGIDERRWPGVTRFKKGFGGFEINYPGTFDLVYDTGWYKIYKMVRKVRRTF